MAATGSRKQLVAAVLLVASAAAEVCGVPEGTRGACLSYCLNGGDKDACCRPMKSANKGCLCKYWREHKDDSSVAKQCADKIRSDCDIHGSC